MANINDLGLVDDPVQVNPDDLPQASGSILPLPQPGTYRFKLPASVAECYEAFQTVERGQRIRARFEGEHALTMVPSGQRFEARLSNEERTVKDKLTSDLAWLLVDGLNHRGSLPNSSAYIHALNEHAGAEFLADLEWQSSCNPKRDIYRDGKLVVGTKGCGTRFAMRAYARKDGGEVYQIPKNGHGTWAEEWACPKCSAAIRAFGQLTRFQAAK